MRCKWCSREYEYGDSPVAGYCSKKCMEEHKASKDSSDYGSSSSGSSGCLVGALFLLFFPYTLSYKYLWKNGHKVAALIIWVGFTVFALLADKFGWLN